MDLTDSLINHYYPYSISQMLENLPNQLFGSISEFVIHEEEAPLGIGSFGVVRRAYHKLSSKEYAIKIITIDQSMNQTEYMLLSRQIAIHYRLDHPHIIKLWAVIAQENKIYMIMDCAENKNLFKFLVKKKGLVEQEAFRIFYQVTDALQYMHKQNVFHRDIKPENILLDANMNIKICDMGWAADDIHRKRTTYCGTYEYMSPEMVHEKKYDYKIDIWALGVLLYELIHCRAPFPASTIDEIKREFADGVYEIKQNISQEYKKLMVKLLQFDPHKRIEIQEIKKSAWVAKFSRLQLNNYLKNTKGEGEKSTTVTSSSFNKENNLLPNTEQKTKRTRHRKYKTLEEQGFNSLMNQASERARQNPPIFTKKQNINLINTAFQQFYPEPAEKKKKNICVRTHTKTESNDILLEKYTKGLIQKMKGSLREDKPKKTLNKKL